MSTTKEIKNVKKSEASDPVKEAVSVPAPIVQSEPVRLKIPGLGEYDVEKLNAMFHRASSRVGSMKTGEIVERKVVGKKGDRRVSADIALRDEADDLDKAAVAMKNAGVAIAAAVQKAGKARL